MIAGRILASVCLAVMSVAIAWGLVAGDFRAEGAALMGMPWGVITIVDVYAGAALFSGWIAYRERSLPRVAAWVVAIALLGNLATSFYALLAIVRSGGDSERLWFGENRR